jgi:hypothetical protein
VTGPIRDSRVPVAATPSSNRGRKYLHDLENEPNGQ